MLIACDGHTSTRLPARSVRQRWHYEYIAHQYKRTTTLGADIGHYEERTFGERDNQIFGTNHQFGAVEECADYMCGCTLICQLWTGREILC